MPNIQQPEMRRSGKDPLVQDSVEQRASSAPGQGGGQGAPVPPGQQSPYGPKPPRERRGPASDDDAVLVGGPRDTVPFRSDGVALVTMELDGLVHRYIRTTAHRELDHRQVVVYAYDGEVRPETIA
jgi:hypothetical protein